MRPFRVKRCHQQQFCQLWLTMFLQFMHIVVSAFYYFVHFTESTMWLFDRFQCNVSGITMTQYYIIILYVDLKKLYVYLLLLCINNVCSAGTVKTKCWKTKLSKVSSRSCAPAKMALVNSPPSFCHLKTDEVMLREKKEISLSIWSQFNFFSHLCFSFGVFTDQITKKKTEQQ